MRKKNCEIRKKIRAVWDEVWPYIQLLIYYELGNMIWHYLISPLISGR